MNCPRCGHKALDPTTPCPTCGFYGGATELEELAHLDYMLAEMESWTQLSSSLRLQLQDKYARRRRQLQVGLGLRRPTFDAEAAYRARLELDQIEALTEVLPAWRTAGWLTDAAGQELLTAAQERVQALREGLLDAPETAMPPTEQRGLARMRYLTRTIERLHGTGRLCSEEAYAQARSSLATGTERWEVAAGLRPASAAAPAAAVPAAAVPAAAVPAAAYAGTVHITEATEPLPARPAKPPHPPRPPLTWERFWQGLFSERTLRALGFLAVLLLFTSAVSMVITNWKTYGPLLLAGLLTLFTAFFYTLGWYMQAQLKLRNSGLALTAAASMLIPVDFVAFYLAGTRAQLFPPDSWPYAWLLASVVGLFAYTLTAYVVQAEFFGYLVGAAAGSAVAAVLKMAGLDLAWWQAFLAAVALCLVLLAEFLRREKSRWSLLITPLWYDALAAVTVILPFSLAWGFLSWEGNLAYMAALAIAWWLGGFVFLLAARRYPGWLLAVAAATVLPTAAWLAQRVLFTLWGISPSWQAAGMALLAPVYLVVGRRLQRRGGVAGEAEEPGESGDLHAQSQVAIGGGVVLLIGSAAWALAEAAVAGVVHPFLAATVVLAVVLWRRPVLSLAASALLLTGAWAWVVRGGGSPIRVGFAWALLAIVHLVVVLGLRRVRDARYEAPVYAAAWLIGGLALLPALVTLDRSALSYLLGNWIAVNGWLALLLHGKEAPGLHLLLALRRLPQTLFQWVAALLLLPWAWLAWFANQPGEARARLALLYVLLAGAMLLLGAWLRRHRWEYGRPWATAAHLGMAVAIVISLIYYQVEWMAAVLLLATLFYLASSRLLHQRLWLVPAGWALPLSMFLGLDWVNVPHDPLGTLLALVPLAYVLGGALLERRRGISRRFFLPLYAVAQLLALVVVIAELLLVATSDRPDAALLWAAGGLLLLALAFTLCAWLFRSEAHAHVAAWLGVLAGALVATAYSQGRGSAAVKATLLAMLYVLSERALHWATLRRGQEPGSLVRSAWRLYRRPLLVAGWLVSVGAIGVALVRNLAILGGGPGQVDWSIAGLLLIAGLYGVSAALFRQARFVWFSGYILFAAWTLLAYRGWYTWPTPDFSDGSIYYVFSFSWAVLALLSLAAGLMLVRRPQTRPYGVPAQVLAHLLMPLVLVFGAMGSRAGTVAMGLGLLFYLLGTWADRWQGPAPDSLPRARCAYPAVLLLPVWALYLLHHWAPGAEITTYGLLLLAFSLPMLFLGRRLQRWEYHYGLPLYLGAYVTAFFGTVLMVGDQPWLIGALLFDTLLLVLSAWTFRRPDWLYPAAATLGGTLLLFLDERGVASTYFGWGLIGLATATLAVAYLFETLPRFWSKVDQGLSRYAGPLLVSGLVLTALGLPLSFETNEVALVGYGAAAALYTVTARWKRRPFLLAAAMVMAATAYCNGALWLGVRPADYGLAPWPGIAAALLLAHWLDGRWGREKDAYKMASPPHVGDEWLNRTLGWWALPLYAAGYVGALVSVFLSWPDTGRLFWCLLLAAAAYGVATYRFRRRFWLLLAVAAAQLAVLAGIAWTQWSDSYAWTALLFTPVTWATALAGLLVERTREEGSPLASPDGAVKGWSRPLYLLVLVDLLLAQSGALQGGVAGAGTTLVNALLVALLATLWAAPVLAYVATALGLLSLSLLLGWLQAPELTWPGALALLALGYGLAGYWIRFRRRQEDRLPLPAGAVAWDLPLRLSGWLVSGASIALGLALGVDLVRVTFRALLRWPLFEPADLPQVQMAVTVLAVLGLFYLGAALVDRRRWLGYLATAMLLSGWGAWLLLLWGIREVQWYVLPAGIYLLGVGYMEWRYGRRDVARWLDLGGMGLLYLSSLVQSLLVQFRGESGWSYTLLLGLEGLALLGWGIARRTRRYLYAGVGGVALSAFSQLVEPIVRWNWIVIGVLGMLVLGLVILIEVGREQIQGVSEEMRKRLELWE